mgnify:CR=1 FL=1
MIRVFVIDSNFYNREIVKEFEEQTVELVDVKTMDENGNEVIEKAEYPKTNIVRQVVANPDYVPKWICVNAGNDLEVQNFLAMDGRELSAEDVERIFGNKACQASPLTTVVSDDGMEIVSFTPLPEREKSDDELAAEIRAARDVLLSETDHLVMPDYPISEEDLSLVKAYRQALRDITEQEGFPRSVEWPEKPEVIA